MSQYCYNLSAQDSYHDENDPLEPDLSRLLRDYQYPSRQTTFDLQKDTIHLLPTYHESEVWCAVCETSAHLTDDYPIVPTFKEVLYGESSNTHTHTTMMECITRTMRKTTIRTLIHITLIRTFIQTSNGRMILKPNHRSLPFPSLNHFKQMKGLHSTHINPLRGVL